MLRVCLLVFLATSVATQGNYDHVPDFDWDVWTALDQYVSEDDGFYSWHVIDTYRYEGVNVTVINMTSQKWFTEEYSDRPVWWHWVGIGVPDNVRDDSVAVVAIAGGSNRDPDDPPDMDSSDNIALAAIANDTQFICAYVLQIPNQPIVFTNDPDQKERSEDDVIAWTWRTYLDAAPDDRDQSVILRAPMTKAIKRTFDTITSHTGTVTRFLPSGASKRGWTTWSITAVDRRVFASAPLVFDLLNMDESVIKHYQALAGWSFAFGAYYNCNLTQELHNPVTQDIWDMEDMFRYRSRLTKPTLLIQATGDEFFLQQDTHYWLDGMEEDNIYLWFVPNAEHSLAPHYVKIYNTIAAFGYMVVDGEEIPKLSWTRNETEDTGIVHVTSSVTPREITAWRAVTLQNDTRRDFRLAAGYPDPSLHPVRWHNRTDEMTQVGDNEWVHVTDQVEDEWIGHLVEMVFDGPRGMDFYQSSEVNVVREAEYAADECFGDECYGTLV